MKVLKIIIPVALIIGTYFLIRAEILQVWAALLMVLSGLYLALTFIKFKPKK